MPRMAKPPSKRGGRRTPSGPARPSDERRTSGPASGPKNTSGTLPPWMPDPGLSRALRSARPRDDRAPAAQRAPVRTGDGIVDPHAGREAARYANPIASREAILQLLADADGPMTVDELAVTLALTEPDRADALGKRVAAMLREGQLLQNRRGGLVPAKRMDLIPGTVIANPEGFGFLRPDSGVGEDLFLPPAEMRKAMHGDRVLASLTNVDARGRRAGVVVDDRGDLVVRADLQEVRRELLVLGDVDRVDRVGEAGLLQHDGGFPAVRRGPGIEIYHGVSSAAGGSSVAHFDAPANRAVRRRAPFR